MFVTNPSRIARVYPRAGGGTLSLCMPSILISGLSPRRRGNQTGGRVADSRMGSIPAQAGEPTSALI